MKESLSNLINNPDVTEERIKSTFAILKMPISKFAEEIEEYFMDEYSPEDISASKFKTVVLSFYEMIVKHFNECILNIKSINNNSKSRFIALNKLYIESETLYDKFFDVSIADYSYNEDFFIDDETDNKIKGLYEKFCIDFENKLIECSDNKKLHRLIHKKHETQKSIEDYRVILKAECEKDSAKEYYEIVNHDEKMCKFNDEIKFAKEGISSFLHLMCFEEKLKNNFNQTSADTYSKIYIKRRVHQFNLSKDDMLLYVIKPEYGLEDITVTTREIFQDIGHFVPSNKKNMENLMVAFGEYAKYELYKVIFDLCSISDIDETKAFDLYRVSQILEKVCNSVDEVCSTFANAYLHNDISYDIDYTITSTFKGKIENLFDIKTRTLFPEIVKLYNLIDEHKEEMREITQKYGNGYSPHKAEELKSRLKEVDKIKAEIISYIENRGLYEKNNISRS